MLSGSEVTEWLWDSFEMIKSDELEWFLVRILCVEWIRSDGMVMG